MKSVNFVASFINKETVFWEILLFCVCVIGDRTLSTNSSDNLWFRAVVDNTTHGLVGFLSWAVVIRLRSFNTGALLQCAVCMFLAMVVDVDHFFAAKSFRLKDAASLSKRPLFHLTSIIVPIAACLWMAGKVLRDNRPVILCYIFIIAWLSHHIRDGCRRGIDFPPFGTTPPIPYGLYIVITLLLPLLVRCITGQEYAISNDNPNIEDQIV